VCAVAFAPGGPRVASNGGDSVIAVWNIETGEELLERWR
jgi:WD40 repeat protein